MESKWSNRSFLQEGVPIGGQFEVVFLLSRLLGDQHARQRVTLERRERVRQPGSQFGMFSDAFWEEPELTEIHGTWCLLMTFHVLVQRVKLRDYDPLHEVFPIGSW